MSSADVATEPAVYAFQTEQGGWRVTGSRVSMDSIIHGYHEGWTPEQFVEQFPTLSLEQVHGAIAFYLRNRQMMDEYIERQNERCEQLRQESAEKNRELRERIRERAQDLGLNRESPE